MDEPLIDLLSEVSHRFQQRLKEKIQVADLGLTQFEAKTLVAIAREPGSNQQVIAAKTMCDKSQMTRAIKTLELQSLIARETSADDWRARNLNLTRAGRAVLVALQRCRRNVARDCLANVSADDRERLARILKRMADDLVLQDKG